MQPEPNPIPGTQESSFLTIGRLKVLSLVALGLALVALVPPCLRALEFPQYIKIFEDFDTALPALTVAMLRVSTEVYFAACGVVAVLLVLKECLLRDRGVCLLINVGATWVGLILWVLLEQAITLPTMSIIRSVSGG